ncbi:recombinase family protein [Actinacidiphila glaucinigra]|uniref:Site-specific DNA recombinase n=1 Tax=Actinacidiphila glaucinigra TaxID=235986 RepID=A0A239F0S7_9ACTN|nr:recombinase family protein [Actinacidiphila glaucinigra]SNS49762.1 Site-specific DNA recombinase [Actinacidiphila glaucinigra]
MTPIAVADTIHSDMLVPLGMYRRVSEDKTLKGRTSTWREIEEQVKEQESAIRAFAKTLPFEAAITRDYCDNNTPASDPFIIRDDFERMLKDLEAGVIRGILFLHSDRLARLVYDAARVCRVFEMNPEYVGLSVEGSVDLSTVEGRGMFVMQATVGNMEIGNIKRRVTRTNRRVAEKGVMHGAPRPFGWNDDRRTLHNEEAKIVRDAILAIPGGYTVADFKRKLTEYGYVPKQTKRSGEGRRAIQHSAAEAILINPRVAGYRLHVPESVRRSAKARLWLPDFITYKDGKPVVGDWEAITTHDEWKAATDEIKARKAANKTGLKGKKHTTTATHLCSGIARCGKCSTPMWSNPYSEKHHPTAFKLYGFRYACLTSQGGCGGVTRVGPPVDTFVEHAFLAHTNRGLGDSVEKAAQLDESIHDSRLDEIADEIADVNERRRVKRISTSAALDMIEELEAERDALLSERGKIALQKRQQALLSPEALSDWENLTMSEKRARLKTSIRAVIVHPSGRGKRFDEDLIEIVWKDNPAA